MKLVNLGFAFELDCINHWLLYEFESQLGWITFVMREIQQCRISRKYFLWQWVLNLKKSPCLLKNHGFSSLNFLVQCIFKQTQNGSRSPSKSEVYFTKLCAFGELWIWKRDSYKKRKSISQNYAFGKLGLEKGRNSCEQVKSITLSENSGAGKGKKFM